MMLSGDRISSIACCWAFYLSKKMKSVVCFLLCLAPLLAATEPAELHGVRLKDLVTIEGVRGNQLLGYGLVVGLNGTGDRQQTVFSVQSLTNLLQKMGVSVNPGAITI